MILIELIFVMTAWRRGWGARALIPWACTFTLSFFMGIGVAAAGGDVESVLPIAVLLELGCLVALAVMTFRSRRPLAASPADVVVHGQVAGAAQSA